MGLLQQAIAHIDRLVRMHNLHGTEPNDPLRALARAHVLTALKQLDGVHKGLLLRFLYEANLVGGVDKENRRREAVILLNGADLTGAVLDHANLAWGQFVAADLSRADLRGAYLMCANLGAVDLIDADLRGTNLQLANLAVAWINGAHLEGADLTGAKITPAQIDSALVDETTILPE